MNITRTDIISCHSFSFPYIRLQLSSGLEPRLAQPLANSSYAQMLLLDPCPGNTAIWTSVGLVSLLSSPLSFAWWGKVSTSPYLVCITVETTGGLVEKRWNLCRELLGTKSPHSSGPAYFSLLILWPALLGCSHGRVWWPQVWSLSLFTLLHYIHLNYRVSVLP